MSEENNNVQTEEQDYVQTYEDQRFAEFNEKSDLLSGGYSPDIDNMQEDDNPDGDPAAIMEGDSGESQQEQPAAPFSTINLYGQAYNFNNKEELEAMAHRGIELNTIANKLNEYGNVIKEVEADPELAKVVIDAMNAYKSGQNQNKPAEEDIEPEQGDDEDYDDYEKRLESWKKRQIVKEVRSQMTKEAQEAQRQNQYARMQQVNNIVTNECFKDPYRQQIVNIINSPEFDAGIRQRASYDGFEFMKAYDFVRTSVLGQPPFYNAPSYIPNVGQQQPLQQQVRNEAPRQSRNAPYTERAGGVPVKPGTNTKGLPDIKKMSTDQFNAYKNSFLLSGLNE